MARRTHQNLALAGAALGIVVLAAQGAVTIPARMAEGGGLLRALVFYFSFLGVLVVTGQVLVWMAASRARPLVPWLAGPTARVMMAGAGLILVLLHAPLLAGGTGGGLADLALHYLVPLAFLVWWVAGPHPVSLRWGRVLPMLLLPAGYALWVLGRGVAIGRWPYPFTSVPDLGWTQVIVNLGGLVLIFALVFLATIAAARLLHSRARFGLLAR
jgi:hypothetical protein